MKTLRIFVVLILGFGLHYSCSEKQDFTQFDDLSITPTLETSIFFVKVQESLINRAVNLNFFTQDFNFDAFEADFFADRVLEGTISYELQNTTSKPIQIELQFLDGNDFLLDTEIFIMDAAPTALLTREVAYGNSGKSLDILRNTSKVRLNAFNFGDNSSVSGISGAAIELRSSAQFMLRLK